MRRPLSALAALCALAALLVATPADPAVAHLTGSTNLTSDEHRLSVVPAHHVSQQSTVEVRLAVENHSGFQKEYIVDFFVDQYSDSLKLHSGSIVLTIAPGGEDVAVTRWAPAYFPGDRDILYRVKENQGGTHVVVGSGSWPITVFQTPDEAPPYLTVAWMDLGNLLADNGFGEQDLRDLVDEMHALEMDTLVITYVEYEWKNGWGPFYPSQIAALGDPMLTWIPDAVGTILDQAESNGQHVVLGLGRATCSPLTSPSQCDVEGPMPCATGPTNEQYNHVVGINKQVAQELWDLYGHHDSLYGWYLTPEFQDWDKCKLYYDHMAGWLDQFGLEKIVMVAPAGSVFNLDTAALNASDVDVFAYQDAVGAGYTSAGSYTFDPYQRIAELDTVFGQYAAQHAGTEKHLWVDLELWQMNCCSYENPPYAALCSRVRDQMAPVKNHVSQYTAYEYLGFMESPENPSELIPKWNAEQLYDGYKAYVDGQTSTLCP